MEIHHSRRFRARARTVLASLLFGLAVPAAASPADGNYQGWLFDAGIAFGSDITEEFCLGQLLLPIAADLNWTRSLIDPVCWGRTLTSTGRITNNFPPFVSGGTEDAESTQPLVSAGGNLYEVVGENVVAGMGQGEQRFDTILSSPATDNLLLAGTYYATSSPNLQQYRRSANVLVKSSAAVQTARTPADLEGTSWRIGNYFQTFVNPVFEFGLATIRTLDLNAGMSCSFTTSAIFPEFVDNADIYAAVQFDNGMDFDDRFVRGGPDERNRSNCTWTINADGYLEVSFTQTRAVDPGNPVTVTSWFVVSDDNSYLAVAPGGMSDGYNPGLGAGFRVASGLAGNAIDKTFLFHFLLTEFGADGAGAQAAGPFGDRDWQEVEAMARGQLTFDSSTAGVTPGGQSGSWAACTMEAEFSLFEHELTGSAGAGTASVGIVTADAFDLVFENCAFQLAADGALSVFAGFPGGGGEGILLRGYVNDNGEVLALAAQNVESDPADPGNSFEALANVWFLLGMEYTGNPAADEDGDGNSNLMEFQQPLPPDSDADGVLDATDNCIYAANADQRDTNGDGFGNICDADFNDDCIVNAIDLGIFRSVFFTPAADQDLNGDGIVNAIDLGLFKAQFFQPPGPNSTGTCGPASVDVTFSFSNTDGTVPGTVSGRIFGLVDDAENQSATSIIIDSFPAALAGMLDEGNDATLWEMVASNSFDIAGGQVTQFNLFASSGGPDGEIDFLCLANEANVCSGSNNVAAFGLTSPNLDYVRSFQPGAVTFVVTPSP